MLKTEYWRPSREPPFVPDQTVEILDWSARLSIDMIRMHTKTDDIPGVADEQLKLYRASAIEAAEHYTGLLLSCQRNLVEPVQSAPMSNRASMGLMYGFHIGKTSYKHRLRYTVADNFVYLYGGLHPPDNGPVPVRPGTRTIRVPIRYGLIDTTNCCNPCSTHNLNHGMMVAYKAGFGSPNDVPAGVVVGCLQYIAWVLEHPGDEILTVRNRRDARSEGAQGTNNIVFASGAMEFWRILDDDIV